MIFFKFLQARIRAKLQRVKIQNLHQQAMRHQKNRFMHLYIEEYQDSP